jgi:hypothetical protein
MQECGGSGICETWQGRRVGLRSLEEALCEHVDTRSLCKECGEAVFVSMAGQVQGVHAGEAKGGSGLCEHG